MALAKYPYKDIDRDILNGKDANYLISKYGLERSTANSRIRKFRGKQFEGALKLPIGPKR